MRIEIPKPPPASGGGGSGSNSGDTAALAARVAQLEAKMNSLVMQVSNQQLTIIHLQMQVRWLMANTGASRPPGPVSAVGGA